MYLFVQFLQGGGILSSCDKDNSTKNNTFKSTKGNYENLNQEIELFHKSMTSTQKSGSVMQLNEAVWMMEAAFNYYHSFTGEDYLETITDSVFIPINYDGFDEVDETELGKIYKQVNNAIYESVESFPAENKKPYLFDLELLATPQGTQILVMTTIGKLSSAKAGSLPEGIIIGNDNPFGSTDYWYPGLMSGVMQYSGKCGSYAGQYTNTRAASTQLPRAARMNLRSGYVKYQTFYVDVVTLYEIEPNDYYDINNDNPYGDYLLWKGEVSDCLHPAMMNIYYNGLAYIIDDRKPSGKVFADCSMRMDLRPNVKGNFIHIIKDLKFGVQKQMTHNWEPSELKYYN